MTNRPDRVPLPRIVDNITCWPSQRPLLYKVLFCTIVALWLLSQARLGLTVSFTGDDVMNMYWSREAKISRLLFANLTPFTTEYRPLGALLYRTMYECFGLWSTPFRFLSYAILLGNLALCYSFARTLTGSREIASLTAIVAAFHSRMFDLYLNNGTIYDLLSGGLYLAVLAYYTNARRHDRTLSLRQWTWVIVMNVAALNSKETAATIPIAILSYELILRWRTSPRVVKKHVLGGIAVLTAITAAATVARFRSGSRLINNDGYRLQVSLKQFLATTAKFLDSLFHLRDDAVTPVIAALIILSIVLGAILVRSRTAAFLAVLIWLTPLPVNFIAARELYAAYISVFMWAILFSLIIVRLRNWLYRVLWRRPVLAGGTLEPERVFLAAGVMIFLAGVNLIDRPVPWSDGWCPGSKICVFQQQIQSVNPPISGSDSILLLSDNFEEDAWTPILLCRLLYRNLDMVVDRASFMPQQASSAQLTKYTTVLKYQSGHFVRIH